MNCGSKQTGLLILPWRCVGLPQRRTSERTSFLQQSKQLRVELQNLILCSGGHSLWYNQHITGANIRTCPGCLLFVLRHSCTSACHVPDRTVTTTALLSKRQFKECQKFLVTNNINVSLISIGSVCLVCCCKILHILHLATNKVYFITLCFIIPRC